MGTGCTLHSLPSVPTHQQNKHREMATPDAVAALQAAVDAASAAVVQQADAVRALKAKAKDGSADKVREEKTDRGFGLGDGGTG